VLGDTSDEKLVFVALGLRLLRLANDAPIAPAEFARELLALIVMTFDVPSAPWQYHISAAIEVPVERTA
jgi:hypothetical protein